MFILSICSDKKFRLFIFRLEYRTEPQYLVEQSTQDGHNFTSLIDSYLHFFFTFLVGLKNMVGIYLVPFFTQACTLDCLTFWAALKQQQSL